MNLEQAARLATIGATRVYATQRKQERVTIVSTEVNHEGRVFITVRPAGPESYFRIRVGSLQVCDMCHDAPAEMLLRGPVCPACYADQVETNRRIARQTPIRSPY